MTDPIKEYARAVAEAVLMVCEESGLPDMDAEDVRESLSDIIASVPRPTAQHHDAPTCVGWWWARRKGKWEAVRVTGWGAGSQDRHVAMVERAGSFTGAVCDAWVGPLLPPDTTEPAPRDDEHHDCHWRRLDDARREDKVVENAAPVATPTTCDLSPENEEALIDSWAKLAPTPDIDPEEVRRALDSWRDPAAGLILVAAAREWLREQPAPGVQREGGVTVDTQDPRHPHEPELSPLIDDEGRCLICSLMCRMDEAALLRIAAARRDGVIEGEKKGVIEGLGRAIEIVRPRLHPNEACKALAFEIKRLKGES